jgi:hypothetical protein
MLIETNPSNIIISLYIVSILKIPIFNIASKTYWDREVERGLDYMG